FVRGDNTAILALDNPSASISVPNGNLFVAGNIQSASWIYAAGGLRSPQVQNDKLCRGVGDTVVCDSPSILLGPRVWRNVNQLDLEGWGSRRLWCNDDEIQTGYFYNSASWAIQIECRKIL
ncbi:MAG: hypothetical protein ACOYK8_10580, partial [Alphaproteobacteria bacterium]